MGRYLIRRTLFLILVLFIVSVLTFLIFVKLPAGDPARRAVGRSVTPEQIEAARVAFGLDKPLVVQYARFAKGLVPLPGWFLTEVDRVKHSELFVAQNGSPVPIPHYGLTTFADGGVRTSVMVRGALPKVPAASSRNG